MAFEARKILVIDDDEDDYLIIQALLRSVVRIEYEVHWIGTYDDGLKALLAGEWSAVLVDYDLGAYTGLDFFREAAEMGVKAPLIMVSGRSRYELESHSTAGEAIDFLAKGELNPDRLDKAIQDVLEEE